MPACCWCLCRPSCLWLPPTGFWLGAVTEAVVDPVAGGGGVGVCKGIAKTTGLMVFGFVAMIVMINIFA